MALDLIQRDRSTVERRTKSPPGRTTSSFVDLKEGIRDENS